MKSNYSPADAARLLVDAGVIEHACDVRGNPAFAKADARTRDATGQRVIDYVRSPAERDAWPARIKSLLELPTEQFRAAMSGEPVRLSGVPKDTGGTRTIGVPTFVRRCISHVFQEVLAQTGDHLLPKTVVAYRPGNREAVRHAILDVAEAVRAGRILYYAKLDFTSYFTAMPWAVIEEALLHYGYEHEFIAKLMAVVRCPLVRRRHERLLVIPNDRGAQMGLAESSTVANMLPFALDAHFEQLTGRVFYRRYSDDILVGSPYREEVVGAVRRVQAWARKNGIMLKGVSPDQSSRSLVRDVRQARVEYLGAEVDQNGRLHMPIGKLKQKLLEIEHRVENLVTEGVVLATSRYGGGAGTELYDPDDVAETVEGFIDYWRGLDPEGARRAETLINKTFPQARPPRSGGPGVVWSARLWAGQADDGAEVVDPVVQHACTMTAMPSDGPPSGERHPEVAHSSLSEGEWEVIGVRLEPLDASRVDARAGRGRQEPYTEEESMADISGEFVSYGVEEVPEASRDEVDEDLLRVAEGQVTNSFDVPSVEESVDLDLDLDDLELNQVVRTLDGAVADVTPKEPPLPSRFAEGPVYYIVAQRLKVQGPPRTVVATGLALNGQLVSAPSVEEVPGRREVAVLRAVRDLVARVHGPVVVAVDDTKLVKRLLQSHRRFQAPLAYGLVVDIHEAAKGSDVLLVAGMPGVPQLEQVLRRRRVRRSPPSRWH